MKKQSSFKMKGFSGFGNSPAKNVLDTKLKDVPKKAKKAVKKGDARPFKVAKNIKFLVIDQKTGRKAFSQKLSKRIIDTKTSQQTYDLTSQLVGLD